MKSLYAFAQETGLPRTTIRDLCTRLELPVSGGLSDSTQARILHELRNHKALKASYKPVSIEPVQTVHAVHEVQATEVLSPSPMVEPLTFHIEDTKDQRLAVISSASEGLEQTQANKKALEQAVIDKAHRDGQELAVRAWQAQQDAFNETNSALNIKTAEILSLLGKPSEG